MLQLRKLSQQGILFKRIHSADFSKRGQNNEFRNEGGAYALFDFRSSLSTKFQGGQTKFKGGANAPLRPPPLK